MWSPIRSADPRIARMPDATAGDSGGSTGPGTGVLPRPGRLRRAVAALIKRATIRIRRATAGNGRDAEEELRDLVARTDTLGREARTLIDEVIGAGDRHVRELMVPRNQVVFLEASISVVEAAGQVRTARHSRFPVVDGSPDEVLGFVHLRDLLIRPVPETAATVAELTRPLRNLPASKGVLAALSEMRRAGDHLALVVDEYGGTAGIVTLEDLIEELVGEIQDEYDAAPVQRAGEVDGLLNLSDFADRAGFELPPGPYGTVGGYLMAALGRLPAVGDEVCTGTGDATWRLRVVALDGRRVSRVGLRLEAPVAAELADPVEKAYAQQRSPVPDPELATAS
jgi:putative hemolysin